MRSAVIVDPSEKTHLVLSFVLMAAFMSLLMLPSNGGSTLASVEFHRLGAILSRREHRKHTEPRSIVVLFLVLALSVDGHFCAVTLVRVFCTFLMFL